MIEVTYSGGEVARAGTGKRYALLIANQTYGGTTGMPALATPFADADALAAVLTRRYGFVTEATLPDGSKLPLLLKDASRATIEATLFHLSQIAGAEDQVLIYYGGHGAPYVAGTLEEYLRAGGDPAAEPLTLSLTRFDCVTLVEASIAVARVALDPCRDMWRRFATEIQRVRYRDGRRAGYATRLHYFSEWIADGARRGLLQDLTPTLGGAPDNRPLRFMTEHRASYPALADDATFAAIGAMEQRLVAAPRTVIPTDRIAAISDRVESGDVLAFATAILEIKGIKKMVVNQIVKPSA